METVRRRVPRSLARLHRAGAKAGKAVVWHRHDAMHVWSHLGPKYRDSTGTACTRRHEAAEDIVGALLAKLDDSASRRTRSWSSPPTTAPKVHLADGGTDTVQGREGQQLGRPIPVRASSAGRCGQARNGDQTTSSRTRTGAVTLLAAAGEPDVRTSSRRATSQRQDLKVHLDGLRQRGLLAGKDPGQRNEIFYFDDNGSLNAVRVRDWKAALLDLRQLVRGRSRAYPELPEDREPARGPLEAHVLFSESPMALRWMGDKLWAFVPMQTWSACSCRRSRSSPSGRSRPASTSTRCCCACSRAPAPASERDEPPRRRRSEEPKP